jgi:hypothetical protein
LSVFYRLHYGECAKQLFDPIPPSSFHLRDTRSGRMFHPFVVDIPTIGTSRFGSTFLLRTAKEWNALSASVFPEQYNLDSFKARVNRLFLDLTDMVHLRLHQRFLSGVIVVKCLYILYKKESFILRQHKIKCSNAKFQVSINQLSILCIMFMGIHHLVQPSAFYFFVWT